MGFFMGPIVTGKRNPTIRESSRLRVTRRLADGKRSACPTTTLRHSENPTAPYDRRHHGWVAQSAEQWTENPRVGGSIPPPAISFFTGKCTSNAGRAGWHHAPQQIRSLKSLL